ncbi:uncharacterized protein CLUP02_06339 [Colletotrichum lupini]|uniref:Uncharacterized protein n=1 Tax=Colletotrichum lupini TaxID=145971 RepID=A0A9Q8SNX2_9PEZI|nr:uncharacterized protein CLUP02_06339 [Colletotrichum lupini]UQC80854.1 hypothetical protein CLUP02_06339 [Colletotrichum lupini]
MDHFHTLIERLSLTLAMRDRTQLLFHSPPPPHTSFTSPPCSPSPWALLYFLSVYTRPANRYASKSTSGETTTARYRPTVASPTVAASAVPPRFHVPRYLGEGLSKLRYDLRYSGNASSDVPSAQQQHISDINEEEFTWDTNSTWIKDQALWLNLVIQYPETANVSGLQVNLSQSARYFTESPAIETRFPLKKLFSVFRHKSGAIPSTATRRQYI